MACCNDFLYFFVIQHKLLFQILLLLELKYLIISITLNTTAQKNCHQFMNLSQNRVGDYAGEFLGNLLIKQLGQRPDQV